MDRAKLLVLGLLGAVALALGGLLYAINLRPSLENAGAEMWKELPLPENALAQQMAIDPRGRVWITGSRRNQFSQTPTPQDAGFLGVWDGRAWREFSPQEVGASLWARDFSVDRDGRMWVAVANGAAVYDDSSWKTYPLQFGSDDCSWSSIAAGDDGRVWLGSASCGLATFDQEEWSQAPPADSPFGTSVTALAVDADGWLWVGAGENRGVFIYEDPEWIAYPVEAIPYLQDQPQTSRDIAVREIYFDSLGRAWVSTNHGLLSIRVVAAKVGQRPDWRVDLPGEPVKSIVSDATGHLYAKSAIREGFIVFDGQRWETVKYIPQKFGQAQVLRAVQALAVHPNGELWIAADDFGRDRSLYILDYFRLPPGIGTEVSGEPAYRLPLAVVPVLILVGIAWLWAALTRTNRGVEWGKARPSGEGPATWMTRQWRVRWIAANTLHWLAAAGILYLFLHRLSVLDMGQSLGFFTRWMPPLAIVFAGLWACGQWSGWAGVTHQAGQLALHSFIGAIAGLLVFIVCSSILLSFFDSLLQGEGTDSIIMAMLLMGIFLPGTAAAGLISFWIAGRVSGARQAPALADLGLAVGDWTHRNGRLMALAGVFGPLGGLVYGLASLKVFVSPIPLAPPSLLEGEK